MSNDDRSPVVRQWRKRPQFNCRFCAYNTLNEQKFVEHMITAHPPLEILEGGMADDPPTPSLATLTRDELNDRALELGVVDPGDRERYPNKDAVIAAIAAVQKGSDA